MSVNAAVPEALRGYGNEQVNCQRERWRPEKWREAFKGSQRSQRAL